MAAKPVYDNAPQSSPLDLIVFVDQGAAGDALGINESWGQPNNELIIVKEL